MGWNGDTLIPWTRRLCTPLAIAAIVVGSCGGRISFAAESPEPSLGAEDTTDEELTAEDLELLRVLDLLFELKLLQEWDPEEDLPILLDAPEAPATEEERP